MTCLDCMDQHVEEVLPIKSPNGCTRFFIQCPENGRIEVSRERLLQWTVDYTPLQQALKAAFSVIGDPEEVAPGRIWNLGRAALGSKSRTLSEQFKVFRWPSWLNPDWSREREAELLEFYGGRDSAGWQHEVAGEHGNPSYGAFNVEQFNLCRQEVFEYQKIVITDSELRDCETEEAAHDRMEMLLNLTPRSGLFWIGGDLGYTNDPTELIVFQEAEVGERSLLKMILRLNLEYVAYPHIAQIIALLERYYTPAGIGVDNGGNGLSVVQELFTLDKYKGLELEGRLKGYDFGGMTRLAVRDGKEIKKRTKELMTSLINGAMQRKQFIFPAEDLEVEGQFTTHTYTLRDGKIIYSKGNDHIVDAVRCAMIVREEGNLDPIGEEMVSLKPVLTDPVFI